MAKYVAAIDVGSNAIRMGIAKIEGKSNYQFVQIHREPVRLGSDAFTQGLVSAENRRTLNEIFARFQTEFKRYEVEKYRAVATSAMRDARNTNEIIEELLNKTKIKLEIIDGLEEARLIHLAISRSKVVSKKQFLLLDIGGGSVEVVLSTAGEIDFMQSLAIGTVRLLDKSGEGHQIKKKLRENIEKHLFKLKPNIDNMFKKDDCDFVVTGGNPRTLGRLRADVFNKTNREKIKRPELEFLVDSLFGCTEKERMSRYQLGENRADVILPASMTMLVTMEMFDFQRIKLPPLGLRDGLVFELAQNI